MYKIIFIIIPALFYLYGCATIPVYRINALEQQSDLYMGMETIRKGNNNAEVTLQFQSQSESNYVFFVKIKNTSNMQYIVEPKNIFSKSVTGENISDSTNYYAVDPEQQIKQFDKEINSTTAQKQTNDGLNVLCTVLDLATDVATIGKKRSDEEEENIQNERDKRQQGNIQQDNYYSNKISSLEDQKAYWMNNMLRTSILYPGDEISGYLYLPIIPKAEIIKVVVPVNGNGYNFLYKQTYMN
ncbi:MAG: hypothetical protein ACYCVH_06910 [Ignavibacteriaceae bacterium]